MAAGIALNFGGREERRLDIAPMIGEEVQSAVHQVLDAQGHRAPGGSRWQPALEHSPFAPRFA